MALLCGSSRQDGASISWETPTLRHVPRTLSSPIVQALLELDCVPDKVIVKTLTFADLKTPEHLALSRAGQVPVLSQGDLTISESGAIMMYLLEMLDSGHRLHPAPQAVDRPVYLYLFMFAQATVYPLLANLFMHVKLIPESEQDAAFVQKSKATWSSIIAPELTSRLGGKAFMIGDTVCAADLFLAKPLMNASELGMLEAHPKLKSWFERVSARPTWAPAYTPGGIPGAAEKHVSTEG